MHHGSFLTTAGDPYAGIINPGTPHMHPIYKDQYLAQSQSKSIGTSTIYANI